MTVHADLKPPAEIGTGLYGTRMVFGVTGGHFEGARLWATLSPSGGDWLLLDANGVGHLDVRIILETWKRRTALASMANIMGSS